ncbi:hypothetical protein [Chryseobacterium wanjuense]
MKTTIDNSFEDFKTALNNSPDLQQEFRENPVKAAENITTNPKETDSWIYRIIVLSFGLIILTIVVTLTIMSMDGSQINAQVLTIFTAISSGSIGALAGLLAPSPGKQ